MIQTTYLQKTALLETVSVQRNKDKITVYIMFLSFQNFLCLWNCLKQGTVNSPTLHALVNQVSFLGLGFMIEKMHSWNFLTAFFCQRVLSTYSVRRCGISTLKHLEFMEKILLTLSSETSVNFCKTTLLSNPEECARALSNAMSRIMKCQCFVPLHRFTNKLNIA